MSRQYIKDIKIEGYRNLENTELSFSDGINIVFGENAQGKTNLIEAVWLLSGGKSFRGSKDREMIGFSKDTFRIEGNVCIENEEYDAIERNIVIACSQTNPKFSTRMAKEDGGDFISPSRIAGDFYCVIFSPIHLQIVSGAPGLRRKFMDACLCQMNRTFMDAYRRYNHALNTRNVFLKEIRKYDQAQQERMFITFDSALADSGSTICRWRKEFISFVSERASYYYNQISMGRESLEIRYSPATDTYESMYSFIERNRERDKVLGYTSVGVHREDFEILLDSRPAKDYASQGQQRSIVIALKLAESDMMEKLSDIAPVILLDDVLSELDFQRQEYLLSNIENKQVFITSCDTERIKLSESRKFYVENGKVRECI